MFATHSSGPRSTGQFSYPGSVFQMLAISTLHFIATSDNDTLDIQYAFLSVTATVNLYYEIILWEKDGRFGNAEIKEIWLEFERNSFNELDIFSEGSFKPKKMLDNFKCGWQLKN